MNKLPIPNANNFELINPNQYLNPQLSSNSNSNTDYKSLYQNLISNLYSNISPMLSNSNHNISIKNSLARLGNLQDQMVLNDQTQTPFTVIFQPANTEAPTPIPPPTATIPPSFPSHFTIALPPSILISTSPPIFSTPQSSTATHDNSSILLAITHGKSATEMSNHISTNSRILTKTNSSNVLRNTTTSQAAQHTKFKLSMGFITIILIQFII
jgi:hypothetical protein